MALDRPPLRNLADIEALEKVPLDDRIGQFRSTFDVIRASAERHPDKAALHFIPNGTADEEPVTLSYGDLTRKIFQAANAFAGLGVGPEDSVSFLMPNLPETHPTLWGAETAGIVNPINPLLEVDAISDIADAAGAVVLVAAGPTVSEEIWDKAREVHNRLPNLKAVLQIGGQANEAPGIIDFDSALEAQPGDRLVFDRRIDPDDTAAWFHTGGTTGLPKLARHTHGAEVYNAWVLAEIEDHGPDDVLMCGLPLFHVNAVMVTGLAPFMVGATVLLPSTMGFRDPNVISHFWRLIERYRVCLFSGVPTLYASLLQVPVEGCDLSSLRYGICGAAPMPVELFKEFEDRTGLRILEGYGLTESVCVASLNPRDGERRVGSIGMRIPYQEMKSVRLNTDGGYLGDCELDEIGTVVIRGPNVLTGYKRSSDNRGAFIDDDWFVTGDLGRMDGEGYFWLTGRSKDVIIRGGHNIDPAVIDDALVSHPDVALAAAVGRPDSYAGELPVAFVTLIPGGRATPDELMAYAADKITERAAVPKSIHILPELPLTAVGKIFKPALRWRAAQMILEDALAPLGEGGVKITVEVGPHERHGTLARVTVSGADASGVSEKAREILGPYPVPFKLETSC